MEHQSSAVASDKIKNIMDKADSQKLSIIIPTYNEERTIGKVIERIITKDVGGICLGLDYEIVVVDDGSRDGTADVVYGSRFDGVWRRMCWWHRIALPTNISLHICHR